MTIPTYHAYLDIETTGLSPDCARITVIGIYLVNGRRHRLIQLVGDEVTRVNLLKALNNVQTIYTYNGSRFDLPFINACLDTDLNEGYQPYDLMYECWRNNLYGGLKAVEEQLSIPRQLKGISGFDAVILWWRYHDYGDDDALALLLEYNKEDVVNLQALRERLKNYQP